ncbi:MAG: hypothetical protein GY881_09770, partial [Gammaproteobacteria bacterium]|nr:hypothetical protein [Gammaproteobacteria bacterium]
MAQQEIARRALSRQHLLPFVKRFNDDYEAGWVHADICQRLEQFSQDIVDKKAPRLMLFMPPRHGKLLEHNTLILTQNRGWTTHGELVVGDKVFHPSGKAVEVIALSEEDYANEVVEFTNGQKIRCHENHEWTIYDRGCGYERTVETKALAKIKLQSGNRSRMQVQNPAALEYPEKDLLMGPYTLGAWLGDGSRGKPCITHDKNDQPVIGRIVSEGYSIKNVYVHKGTGVPTTYFSGDRPNVKGRMAMELGQLGVYKHKYIPEQYLRSSIEQRLQLMAGLIDTDGSCDSNGRVRFTSVDSELAHDVLDLATGLGFKPYISTIQPRLSTSGIQGRKEYYVVGFNPTMDIPCALERKISKCRAVERKIGIVSVTHDPCGIKGRCIQVDSPDGLYLVGRQLIPTHNSELASKTFPAWHLGRNPKHEVIACSYSADLAMDFSRKVRGLIRENSYTTMFPECELDKSSQSAERWNTEKGGGFVAAGVGGGITGRGAHLAIIDDPLKNREEADNPTTRQKLKDWFTSTLYTRLAPGGGLLIILT